MTTLTFTSGDDVYSAKSLGPFTLNFLAGNDLVYIFHGTVTSNMGDGDDTASLRGGTATVFGEAGADRFELYAGSSADGGIDNDTFNLRGGSGFTLIAGSGDDRFNVIAAVSGVSADGGAGNDEFLGNGLIISGSIEGGDGDDRFAGFKAGAGLVIHGGLGDDVYRWDAQSTVVFTEGVGEGIDAVQLARGASYAMGENIENVVVGTYAGSTIDPGTIFGNGIANKVIGHNNVENIFGNGGNDRLYGKGGDDHIEGGDGNDIVDGGSGNDELLGGIGNDRLNGRQGDDSMAGGTGNDVYYVDSVGDTITENAVGGTDGVYVGPLTSSAYILPDGIENAVLQSLAGGLDLLGNVLDNQLFGNGSPQYVRGLGGNDALHGGGGDDSLAGDEGDDSLYGEDGNDFLLGGNGADRIYGGAGNDEVQVFTDGDTVTGGSGNDIFEVTNLFGAGAYITITDFETTSRSGNHDILSFQLCDGDTTGGGTYDPLTYIGASPFSGAKGELRADVVSTAKQTTYYFACDTTGDQVADFSLVVVLANGATTLPSGELLF